MKAARQGRPRIETENAILGNSRGRLIEHCIESRGGKEGNTFTSESESNIVALV